MTPDIVGIGQAMPYEQTDLIPETWVLRHFGLIHCSSSAVARFQVMTQGSNMHCYELRGGLSWKREDWKDTQRAFHCLRKEMTCFISPYSPLVRTNHMTPT